jgi:hypothetical protein
VHSSVSYKVYFYEVQWSIVDWRHLKRQCSRKLLNDETKLMNGMLQFGPSILGPGSSPGVNVTRLFLRRWLSYKIS